MLPNQWSLKPAGKHLVLGDFPVTVALHPIDNVAAVLHAGSPVLVVAGEEDAIFPAPLLRELAEQLGARYVELARAGHSPYFESPAAYNEALLAFLV